MARRESLRRINHIVNRLKKGDANFEEIVNYIDKEASYDGVEYAMSKRTFQRDVKEIEALYGREILYNRTTKQYTMSDVEESVINERLLEAYDVMNAINLTDSVSEEIHFERRRSQGTENLWGLLHGIKNHKIITFTYQSYYKDAPEDRKVKPLAIKEYKGRWYVIGTNLNDDVIKTFALDRLTDLNITTKSFKREEGFNVDEYYEHSFGIVGPNLEKKPDEVMLQFSAHQGQYLKSLPLHPSQTIVKEDDEFCTLKVTLHITKDFVMEVLSHGKDVKVCSPQKLIDEMKQIHLEALEYYK